MWDIHSHILPGIDDGARKWDDSLAMARAAVEDGILGAVCTPHWISGLYANECETVRRMTVDFQNRLDREDIVFRVFPGSELRVDPDLVSGLTSGVLSPLNSGPYVLLELPPAQIPPQIDTMLWKLRRSGYVPIIAHPERQDELCRNPERILEWVRMGVLTQITGSSLLGRFGPGAAAMAEKLLRHNLAHFLATDCHGLTARRPNLARARDRAAAVVGPDTAVALTEDNPLAVIHGTPLTLPDPVPFQDVYAGVEKKKGFFRRLLGG